MCRFTVLAISILFYEQTVFSARVDQRQTGDLNVQIDLKNLQIVGLMKGKEEYVEYDYAYDYSEMTIKPDGITTRKPLNVTVPAISNTDNTTRATTVLTELDQTTSSSNQATETISSTVPSQNVTDESSTATAALALDGNINTNATSSDCKKGFFRNIKGNCELKLQNPSNALLKMIKQKSKLIMSNGMRQP